MYLEFLAIVQHSLSRYSPSYFVVLVCECRCPTSMPHLLECNLLLLLVCVLLVSYVRRRDNFITSSLAKLAHNVSAM